MVSISIHGSHRGWIGNWGPVKVTVLPAIPEWEERPEDYHAFVEALRDQGIRARFGPHPIPPSGSDIPDFLPIAVTVYCVGRLGEAVLQRVIDEVAAILVARAKLSWTPKRKARAVIFGPRGEILKEVVIDAEDARRKDQDKL